MPIEKETGWTPGPFWIGAENLPHRDRSPDLPNRSESLIAAPKFVKLIHFSLQIVGMYSGIMFHDNFSGGIQVRRGRTDMKKILAFHNSA